MIAEEKKFVKEILEKYSIKRGEALDIGCGPKQQRGKNADCAVFPDIFIGVDKNRSFEPDIVLNFVTAAIKLQSNKYRLVLLSHMLEDCENPYDILRSCRRVLKNDGLLMIVQPDRNKYHRIGSLKANPGHRYDFEFRDVHYMIEKVFFGKYKVVDSREELSGRSFGLVVRKLNPTTTKSNYFFPGLERNSRNN